MESSVFSKLDSRWTFMERSDGMTTDVRFEIEFQVKNPVIASAVSVFFEEAVRQQVQAFKDRCVTLRDTKAPARGGEDLERPTRSRLVHTDRARVDESQSEKELARVERVLHEETARRSDGSSQLLLSWVSFEAVCVALRDLSGFTQINENEALRRAVYSALQSLEVDSSGNSLPLSHIARTLFVLVQAPPLVHAKLLFTIMDVDHDGLLNRRELTSALEKHMDAVESAVHHLLRLRAERYGSDSSRSVRVCGLVDSLIAEVRAEVPLAVQQLLDDFDSDGSRTISLAEWEEGIGRHPELMDMMSVQGMAKMIALASANYDVEP